MNNKDSPIIQEILRALGALCQDPGQTSNIHLFVLYHTDPDSQPSPPWDPILLCKPWIALRDFLFSGLAVLSHPLAFVITCQPWPSPFAFPIRPNPLGFRCRLRWSLRPPHSFGLKPLGVRWPSVAGYLSRLPPLHTNTRSYSPSRTCKWNHPS